MLSRNQLVFGTPHAPAKALPLRAGPLALLFEPDTVFLRRICLGETEVIRAIYAAVRDRHWGTVAPCLSNLHIERHDESFQLRFDVECHEHGIHFQWRGKITGQPDGTVNFSFDGVARTTFLRNRIGFCVLHPLEGCAGRPCLVEHTDGAVEHGRFPMAVSPHQPFRQIRAISHEPVAGSTVRVAFDGDVFEMEDQRNWTDASFKTYCTPLERPFPAQIEQGSRLRQSVTLLVKGPAAPALTVRTAEPRSAAEAAIPRKPLHLLPPLGLCVASHGGPLTTREIGRLKRLELSHLRADLHLVRPDWRQALDQAVVQADALGAGLHLALFLPDPPDAALRELGAVMPRLGARIALWLVYDAGKLFTSEYMARVTLTALRQFDPAVPIAAGTNASFVELNRNRLPLDGSPLPCFSINPQVHTFDHVSLMENVEAQPHAVQTAHAFSARPVVISPITLRARSHAGAAREEQTATGRLPAQVDPRQTSLFGAAWTFGSIANLSGAGHIDSLTYYETTGWRGVMETETGSSLPERFASIAGGVFPLYHVFADLAGFTSLAPMPALGSRGLAGLTLFDASGRRRVLVANLSHERTAIRLTGAPSHARVRMMDETNVETAMREPEGFGEREGAIARTSRGVLELALKPYALARVDPD